MTTWPLKFVIDTKSFFVLKMTCRMQVKLEKTLTKRLSTSAYSARMIYPWIIRMFSFWVNLCRLRLVSCIASRWRAYATLNTWNWRTLLSRPDASGLCHSFTRKQYMPRKMSCSIRPRMCSEKSRINMISANLPLMTSHLIHMNKWLLTKKFI